MIATGIDIIALELAELLYYVPRGTEFDLIRAVGRNELCFQWLVYGDRYKTPGELLEAIESKTFEILDIMDGLSHQVRWDEICEE